MPWLVPRSEQFARYEMKGRTVIGRNDDADLHLDQNSVSRIHCVIQRLRDGSWAIHDPGSRNGTWVNGERIHHMRALKDGDLLSLGSRKEAATWEFHTEEPPAATPDQKHIDSLVQTRIMVAASTAFAPEQQVEDTRQLRQDYERLRAAWEMVQRLAGEVRVDHMLGNALDALLDMFSADRGIVLLRDRNGLLRRAAHRSRSDGRVGVSDTLLAEVLDAHCAVISRDALQDERFAGAESIVTQGIRATMAAPLMHAGKILGVIVLDSAKSLVAFTEDDLAVFETAVRQLALTLHNLDLAENLRQKEAERERFERLVTPSLAAQIASGMLKVERRGQARDVTVLFCDIRGFTSLSERLSATDLVELLNIYYEEMVDIVFEHEGTLDKIIGDAVMAIFGAPSSQPDHAERALRTAVQMQRRMAELIAGERPALREPIGIGIGLNSGEVVAGFLGSPVALDYTVIGDVVNTADRICSAAPAGGILIGESTQTQIGKHWRLKARTAIQAKGKAEGVGVFEVEYREGL